jgi:polysaccharide biosynthesis/export protein
MMRIAFPVHCLLGGFAMKFRLSATSLPFVALALSLCSVSLIAQQAPPGNVSADPQQPAEPRLKLNPDKALEAFEPPADEEYRLGAGDQITLDFPGRPELTTKQITIGPDGRITIPLAGSIHIADLTRSAASKAIVDSLSTYYTDVTVTVSIDKYTANYVSVQGYVQHPGEISFEGTPTLLSAISRAGLISTVTKDGVPTNGNGVPETCTIYRGNDTAVQVQLRSLLMSGNSLAGMRLRRNDIVFVPAPKESFVSVLGQVAHPGTVPLTPETTLVSVLAESGCCMDSAGSINIHIIQPSTGTDFVIPYKKVMTLSGLSEYKLHSGDVILIPKSTFYKLTDVLQRISPVATMVSLAALVGAG